MIFKQYNKKKNFNIKKFTMAMKTKTKIVALFPLKIKRSPRSFQVF